MAMAPQIDWGWGALNKLDDLERRVAKLEAVFGSLIVAVRATIDANEELEKLIRARQGAGET